MPHPHPTRRGLTGLSLAALCASPARAADWVEPLFRRVASPGREKRIALTLDACAGAFDARIAQGLVEQGARATIFLTGRWIRANPEGLAFLRAHPHLFTFENHGARHLAAILGTGTMYGLSIAGTPEAVRQEVEDGAKAIRAATGHQPGWYRGATGRYSPEVLGDIGRLGHRIAAWSLNADAGASLPAAAVAARLGKAQDGEVILGHVNHPERASGEGIVAGVAALRRAGFAFVDLDTLVSPDAPLGAPSGAAPEGGQRDDRPLPLMPFGRSFFPRAV